LLTFILAVLLKFPDSIKFISGLDTTVTAAIAYKGAKIVAIWQHDKRVLGIFSLRMRINGYLGASGQKSDLAFSLATSISYKTDVFPLPSDVYGIYSMFLCYYVA